MNALAFLKQIYPTLNEKDKSGYINGNLWIAIANLMEDYAFQAWMAGEENGRKRLSSDGDLDVNGSMHDFEQWKKQ